MTKERARHLLAQLFLTLAYIAVTLQWLWVLALGLPPLIETGIFDSLTPPKQVEQPVKPTNIEPSPLVAIFAGFITLLFLIVTIYIIIKIPKTINKTGNVLVHQTTEAIVPVVTHHKKIPAKKKQLLSRRITMTLQLLLIAIPFALSFFVPPVQTITSQVITTLAIWLAGFGVICFSISWLLKPQPTSRTRSHASRG